MATIAIERRADVNLSSHSLGINHIAFDPRGNGIAVSDASMNVRRLIDESWVADCLLTSKNEKVRPTERIRDIAFSMDGRTLFVAAGDTLYGLDAESLETVWTYEPPRSFGFLIISPIALAVAGNGDVAASFDNGSMAVWDAKLRLKVLWQDNDTPRRLGFSTDGKVLMGSDSFSVCLWDVQTRQKVKKLPLVERAYGIAMRDAEPRVALRTLHSIEIWDLTQMRRTGVRPALPGLPICAFHPSENLVISGSRNGVQILNGDLSVRSEHWVDEAAVTSLAVHPSGNHLLVGLSTGDLRSIPV